MIDVNPAKMYLTNLSSRGSRDTMRNALRAIARILEYEHWEDIDWAKIEYKHTAYTRSKLIEKGYAAATINRHLTCLRGVIKEAWRLGVISAERRDRASDLKKVYGNSARLGRVVTIEEQRIIARACIENPKPIGRRDYAILNVARLGLRSIEISRLNLSDCKQKSLQVFGKGNKYRPVPLPTWCRQALDDWIAVRGDNEGALFTSVKAGTCVTMNRLRPDSISRRIKEIALNNGLTGVTSHCFRFTFVSESLDRGLDILSVQRAVGHSTPTMTARYDLRGQGTLRDTMNEFEDLSE